MKIQVLFLFLLVLGCSSGIELPNQSDMDAAGIVAGYIGTPVTIAKGISLSSDKENEHYYELEINDRSLFGNYPEESIASGCILNFYNNITPEDRAAHTSYIFTIKEPNQEDFTISFDSLTLDKAHEAFNIYENLFWDMYNKKLGRVSSNMHPSMEGFTEEILLNSLIEMDELYGELDSFQALSFEEGTDFDGLKTDWVNIKGMAIRGEELSNYDLTLSIEDDQFTILFFKLK